MSGRPDIYVSSGAFGQGDLSLLLKMARDWGVSNLELTAGLRRADDLASKLTAADDIRFLVHNYCPPPKKSFVLNLASEDPETLELSRRHCRSAVDLSQILGSRWYSVHAGFAAKVRPEHLGRGIPLEARTDKGKAQEIFENSIRELVAYAAPRGVGILIENNVVERQNLIGARNEMLLLATGEELLDFCQRCGSESLGLLIDLGHVNVSSMSLNLDRETFLAKVAPWTRALHLSENDGVKDSNQPFGRDSWLVESMRAFDPEYVVVESYRLDERKWAACVDAIEFAYEQK